MYSVYYSPTNNRIYITISGKLEGSEASMYRDNMKSLICIAKENFTICINMSAAHVDMLKNSDEYKDVREYAATKRILAAIHILSKEHYVMHQKCHFPGVINACTSLKYAEKFLDNILRRDDSENVSNQI